MPGEARSLDLMPGTEFALFLFTLEPVLMRARLLILLGMAGILAVVVAVKVSNPSQALPDEEEGSTLSPDEQARLDMLKSSLASRDLPGEEPPEKPEFQVQVEVNQTSGKNRLDFWVTETHGYFVETLKMQIWYKTNPDMELEDSSFHIEQHFEAFITAGETLKLCMELVPAELRHVGDGMGVSENWGARVTYYHRARVENPDPLPLLAKNDRCDE